MAGEGGRLAKLIDSIAQRNSYRLMFAQVKEVTANGVKVRFLGDTADADHYYQCICYGPYTVDDFVVVARIAGSFIILGKTNPQGIIDHLTFKTYTDATRPSAVTLGAGAVINNSDDGGLNVSNGSVWREPEGGWVNT